MHGRTATVLGVRSLWLHATSTSQSLYDVGAGGTVLYGVRRQSQHACMLTSPIVQTCCRSFDMGAISTMRGISLVMCAGVSRS